MAKQGRRVVWRNQAETAAGDLLLLYFCDFCTMCAKEGSSLTLSNFTGGSKRGASFSSKG